MRREERIAVDAAARLHPNEWSSLEVRLLDLSPNGFRAQCDARVPAGSCVALELPNKGRVIAYVSWRRGDRFGAQFAEPIKVEAAGWGKLPQERSLARMLVERSQAYAEGEIGQELELRRRILNSLPMRRGVEPEPEPG
jgi:hypothetical protein